jgi:hypothetical protein
VLDHPFRPRFERPDVAVPAAIRRAARNVLGDLAALNR